jgi:hypothetical protein
MAEIERKKHAGGRPLGRRNKLTIERERKALEELKERARHAEFSPLAKDELAALIPEAKELLGIVKGIVARFQRAAIAESAPASAWNDLKDWMSLYAEVMLKASQIEYKAADFQSPKFRAIVVAPAPEQQPGERVKKFTLKVFDGGRGMIEGNGATPPRVIEVQPIEPSAESDSGEV